MLTVMLPDTVEEPEIRKMMHDAEETCEKLHMEILGGHVSKGIKDNDGAE